MAIFRKRAGIIFGLALGGTLLTALFVGTVVYWLLGFDWLTSLLLGIIIAPTDPVSVLATFKAAKVNRELSTIVESESLFNDGIAVVLYVIVLRALGGAPLNAWQGLGDFLLVVGGGTAVGLAIGFLVGRLLKRVDDHLVQVMATLIVVYGAYLLAEHFHLSGVVAVAVAGLAVGNHGLLHTSDEARENVGLFWEVLAFLVNSTVFLLIGFTLIPDRLVGDLLAAAVVFGGLLGTRALIVYGLSALIDRRQGNLPRSWRHIIFWGGMRGAVPVALALGLPSGLAGRETVTAVVFGVVLFSLLGQGLTMPALLRRSRLSQSEEDA
jgi:CPA1 family monovalent cation:H+ antiporter